MPVPLKQIKRDLQRDVSKVGKTPDGEYKFVPPNIVGRRIANYPKLKISKLTKKVLSKDLIDKDNRITFQAVAASESSSTKYKVTAQFHDIEFKELETKLFNNKIIQKNGPKKKSLFFKPLTYGTNGVKLRCQCMDFRHRFSKPLLDQDGLFGSFIPYTRKTDPWPVGRPSVNSTDKLGICKHISSLLQVLEKEKYLKNR